MQGNVNITGYLNDSPHRFNDKNIIPAKTITMDNVNIPLMLRPNKGKPIYAAPNSGEYHFPQADYVEETPLPTYQMGGSDCPEGFEWSPLYKDCVPSQKVFQARVTLAEVKNQWLIRRYK